MSAESRPGSSSGLNPGRFHIEAADAISPARAGRLDLRTVQVETPAFMPVGTAATVKAMDPRELAAIGYRLILANAFHLEMRPGSEIIERLGGLHRFMGWQGGILTDSGGFQVFSLQSMRKIAEEGVEFRSPVDGAAHFFTPERATAIQRRLDSDIVMAFDECIPAGADRSYVEQSTQRTLRWLRRCAGEPLKEGQLLFGIVQGGMFPDLRRQSAEETAALGLPGCAIGGLSVGEAKPATLEALEASVGALPREKPRYAMGVGTPADFIEFVDRGIDLFDCVQPTRHARNGQLFTRRGAINIRNARWQESSEPPDPSCGCPLCSRFSLAYLRHLFVAREILAMRLLTAHNLQYFHDFLMACRDAIRGGRWTEFRVSWREAWMAGEEEGEGGN